MKDYALSNHDIQYILNNDERSKPEKLNLIEGNNINKKTDIFKNSGHALFFIGNPNQTGHWTSATRSGETKKIFYFDSLGDKIPKNIEENLILNYPDYDIFYNSKKYQGDNSKCCGKYSSLHIMLNKIKNCQFKIIPILNAGFKKTKNYDKFIIEYLDYGL